MSMRKWLLGLRMKALAEADYVTLSIVHVALGRLKNDYMTQDEAVKELQRRSLGEP